MPQDNAGTGAPVERAQAEDRSQKSEVGGQRTEEGSAALSMADALGIPAEIQEQLKEKSEVGSQRSEEEDTPRAEQQDSDDGPTEEEDGSQNSEVGDQEEEEEQDEDDGKQEKESPFKDKRVQERIDKLTRRRRRAEEHARELEDELERFQAQGQQEQQNRGGDAVSTLDNVRTERELNQIVNTHETQLEFCDAHAEGVEGDDHTRPIVDEKGKVTGYEKKFYEPAEIAKIRRDSERILLKAERTRGRIREFGAQLQKWNGTAKEIYPELFPTQEQLKDQDASEEYYYAASMVQAAPQIFGSLPEANLLLGDLAFAKKCRDNPAAALQVLQARLESKKNGRNGRAEARPSGRENPDIPPLLRKRQPPLAPHTAGRPSGNTQPSTARKKQEAMSELVADPDGGAEALAKVFAASEGSSPGRRTPVGAAT